MRPNEPRKKTGPSDSRCSPPPHDTLTATPVRWLLASSRQPSDRGNGSPMAGVPTGVGEGVADGVADAVAVALTVGLGCEVLPLFQCGVGDAGMPDTGLTGETSAATAGVAVASTMAVGAFGLDRPQLASIQTTRQAPRYALATGCSRIGPTSRTVHATPAFLHLPFAPTPFQRNLPLGVPSLSTSGVSVTLARACP